MNQMIGFCGIICSECPAYLATKTDDDETRIKWAGIWSKEYKTEIKPEDINCEGCYSTNGILFTQCKVCEMRKCGLTKDIPNCAHCPDYSCQKVSDFHKFVPSAKETLDHIYRSKGAE